MASVDFTIVVRDEDNVPEADAEVHYKLIYPPNEAGIYSDKTVDLTTNLSGEVTLSLFQGAVYDIWIGESQPVRVEIPVNASTDPEVDPEIGEYFELPPIVGNSDIDPCKTVP